MKLFKLCKNKCKNNYAKNYANKKLSHIYGKRLWE